MSDAGERTSPLDVTVVGGGPAGLYASLLLKRMNPAHQVKVYERNPADATYGWGIVLSDRTLTGFQEADPRVYEEITRHQIRWESIETHVGDQVIRSRGHRYLGIGRHRLLSILQQRCDELDVQVSYETEVQDVEELGADLVIAADGVNSSIRERFAGHFEPTHNWGRLRYIWLGIEYPLETFPFIFRDTEYGLFQCHAYPFDDRMTTAVVMCDEATWKHSGLDEASEADSVAFCNHIFADKFGQQSFISNKAEWYRFPTVRTRHWSHNNIVLLGDAAHTVHFTIGSGTKLAMEDAIALVKSLKHQGSVATALGDYELDRRPVVEAFQQAGIESETYCEDIPRYLHYNPYQFAFQLLARSGRLDYDSLRLRDAHFVDLVDGWFEDRATQQTTDHTNESPYPDIGGPKRSWRVAAPPFTTGLQLRGRSVTNRVAVASEPLDADTEGSPTADHTEHLIQLAGYRPGLILSEFIAVAPKGRISPRTVCMAEESHATAWRDVVEAVRREAYDEVLLTAHLGHAGRRGATRSRVSGLDRPLSVDAWSLLAPSQIGYGPDSQIPTAMTARDMKDVISAFRESVCHAEAAGFDAVLVNISHGYLLGSFLSPLSNTRDDDFGGCLVDRMRFPLEVFEAVRDTWPSHLPAFATVTADDWAEGGITPDEASAFTGQLRDRGCDLVLPTAGHTVPTFSPDYEPGSLATYADKLRNENAVPAMVTGGISSLSQVNTLLASGRADLCMIDRP